MNNTCELVNTYEVLEYVMGIRGLHPHRLHTVKSLRQRIASHIQKFPRLSSGVLLDIGCGSGDGTYELAKALGFNQKVIGIDISAKAILRAKESYQNIPNLVFYQGTLEELVQENPTLLVAGAMSVSVSMFVPQVEAFYKEVFATLMPHGIFIDAPFLFRDSEKEVGVDFKAETYSVCGCNMQMKSAAELASDLKNAGFNLEEVKEGDFDLMKLPVLFGDYGGVYLLTNMIKNIISPPGFFKGVSARYLLVRTIRIFLFFFRNRHRYAAGELVGIKQNFFGQSSS